MQERWTSFWGHVDDLRQTLLRSLIVIGVGFIFALGCYQPLLNFLALSPHKQTADGLMRQAVQRERIMNQSMGSQEFHLPLNAWLVKDTLSQPVEIATRVYSLAPGESLIYEKTIVPGLLIMGPIEGISLVVKFCFWLSLALTAPFWGWFCLQFILPGLKPEERIAIYPFLVGSLLAVMLGGAFGYYFTLPIANDYLISFNQTLGENAWTLNHYVNYVLLICTGHAVAAELALLLLVLVHFRLLSVEWLINKRRLMIVAAFLIGALLTPPDVVTQLLLALPLIILYEFTILYAKWRNRHVMRFYPKSFD